MPLADHLAGGVQKLVRRLGADMHRGPRLQQMNIFHQLQHDVGDLAHAVGTVALQPSDIDVGEIVVGAALLGGDAHLRWCRMVVHLDPQAGEDLLGPVTREGAGSHFRLVEGRQMLIEMPRIHRIPAIQLRNGAQMAEPVHLHRLMKGAGGVGGHAATDRRDLAQISRLGGVALCGGLALQHIGMAFSKHNGRIARDSHRLEFLGLVVGLHVQLVVQTLQMRIDLALVIHHPLAVELPVEHGVSRRALLHELGETASLVGRAPFRGHVREDTLALGPSLPVGDHLACIGVDVCLTDVVGLLLPAVEHLEILHAVTGQLGKGWHGLGHRTPFAHNQLIGIEIEALLLAVIQKGHRPHHRHRIFSLVELVELRLMHRPLDRQRGLCLETLLTQTLNPGIHPRRLRIGIIGTLLRQPILAAIEIPLLPRRTLWYPAFRNSLVNNTCTHNLAPFFKFSHYKSNANRVNSI